MRRIDASSLRLFSKETHRIFKSSVRLCQCCHLDDYLFRVPGFMTSRTCEFLNSGLNSTPWLQPGGGRHVSHSHDIWVDIQGIGTKKSATHRMETETRLPFSSHSGNQHVNQAVTANGIWVSRIRSPRGLAEQGNLLSSSNVQKMICEK